MFADLERVTVDDSGFTMQHTPVEGRGTIAAGHEDPDEFAAWPLKPIPSAWSGGQCRRGRVGRPSRRVACGIPGRRYAR